MATNPVRVLLSDGSGLTSRQAATLLAGAGHEVESLTAESLPLTRLTRHVRRVHRVPAYGLDPWGWYEAVLGVLRRRRSHVLLPTQEQAALLSRQAPELIERGVGVAVPPWRSLLRLQDKPAAHATLDALRLPQPPTVLARSPEELLGTRDLPVFVKAPVGTASAGVFRIESESDLPNVLPLLADARAFEDGGALVQKPVAGPLLMIQAIFRNGELIAWHANSRVREGLSGGASHKRSVRPPGVGEHLERIGHELAWHGALSLDAILAGREPLYIDVNPRLVEPGNAFRAGVDLVDLMVRISLGAPVSRPALPVEGVRTHQLLLALLGAAASGGRGAVLRETRSAVGRRSAYRDSHEELTPLRGDPIATASLVALTIGLLARPSLSRALSSGAVSAYALTPEAWRAIRAGNETRSGPAA